VVAARGVATADHVFGGDRRSARGRRPTPPRVGIISRRAEESGYDPNVYDRRVRLSIPATERFVDWIGDPVPGVEHKWRPHSRVADRGDERVTAITPTTDLLDDLRDLGQHLGKTPSMADMRNEGAHSAKTYQNRFGAWSTAIAEAGFEPSRYSPRGSPRTSKDALLDAIRSVADELNHTPTTIEFDEHAQASPRSVYRHFDTWSGAIAEAGLPPVQRDGNRISDADLIDELQAAAMAKGDAPTWTEMKQLGEYSPQTYRKRFGSWGDALEAADVLHEPVDDSPAE
jgi:hypothetical protein